MEKEGDLSMQPPVALIGLGEMGGVFARGFPRTGHPGYRLIRGMDPGQAASAMPDPQAALTGTDPDRDGLIQAMVSAFSGDPDEECTGRSAPARLARTLEYADRFVTNFLEGYRTENRLDKRWLELLPLILKRRQILLYVAIHRGFDVNNLGEWATRYIENNRQAIIDRLPVLDLNWRSYRLSD